MLHAIKNLDTTVFRVLTLIGQLARGLVDPGSQADS